MNEPTVQIRRVEPPDVPAVVGLVHDLAEYERAASECTLTTPQLHTALFSNGAAVFGHVALVDDVVVGCALWFLNFSTWRGRHGIYLEDLFVQPVHRGRGLGRALLVELARECATHHYGRLEWAVLHWNEPSIGFYRALGASAQDEWTTFRLTDDALARLAEG